MFLRYATDEMKARAVEQMPAERRREIALRAAGAIPGARIERSLGVLDALRAAGGDFEVETAPVFAEVGGAMREVAGVKATVRGDTGAPLGVVGSDYGLIQSREAFAAAEQLAAEGSFEVSSVVVADGGARLTVAGLVAASTLRQLGRSEPDVLAHLALFETAHDGTRAARAGLWTVRLVCTNGMTARERVASVSVPHRSRAAERILASARKRMPEGWRFGG